jgi:hypothetical protein
MHVSKSAAAAWIVLTIALNACHDAAQLPPDLFPEKIDNVWTRTDLRELPVSEAPDPVPRTAVDRLESASYKGPGEVDARVYVLTSASIGVELVQRWRPSADTIFFNHGRYFVVVKWQAADRKALQDFVRELETRLGRVVGKK